MDLKKTGALIAGLRKQRNLTQKELAALLGVTVKAISRWETGKGFPDVSILEQLAKAMDVTITELVNGERCTLDNVNSDSDRAVLSALDYARSMNRTLICVILAIVGVGLLLAPLVVIGANNGILMVCGASLLIIAAIVCYARGKWSEKCLRLLALLFLLSGLILESIPGSAVLIFASGPQERSVEYVSCFDLILVGYANAAPFLSAVMTVISAAFSLPICLGFGKKLKNAAYFITILAAIFMTLPVIFFGAPYFTPLAMAVVFSLAVSCWLQAGANAAAKK